MGKRKPHTAAFKAQVALAALKGDRTVNEVAAQFGAHPTLIRDWKKKLLAGAAAVFEGGTRAAPATDGQQAELFEQIGRLEMELAWVGEKPPPSCDWKREQVEPDHPGLSARRQCELLGLTRSNVYYRPIETPADDLRVMRLIDGVYTARRFYGSRRMAVAWGRRGEVVNRERVQRLLRLTGLEAIYPKPRATVPAPGHRVYPYRLRGVAAERPGHVWSADITYRPWPSGFMCLAAAIEWLSRYVVAWRLSNAPDGSFGQDMLAAALATGTPEVFDTDPGVPVTARALTGRVARAGAAVSMGGRGRCLDNVFVERLWRSAKYADVYIRGYASVPELERGLAAYFRFYNAERPHQSLGYRTPAEVHAGPHRKGTKE